MEGSDLNAVLLERALREDPHSFEFFAAVRALERLRPDRSAVGEFGDPETEVAHFTVPAALAFPASQIQALDLEDEDGPAEMDVNFMGLTGPSGVLPYVYTQLLIDRDRERDTAPAAFLDIFHHRIISLFYRAWEKHRFGVRHEKAVRTPSPPGERKRLDPLTEHLLDLSGVGPELGDEADPARRYALSYYMGLLAPQQRSAVALEQLLGDYFGVPAKVEQFAGGWFTVGRQDQCELDDGTISSQLGFGALVGDEIYDPQGRVRIRLGPLTRERYEAFLPTGSAHADVRRLAMLFAHGQFEFELQLVLARDEVPGVRLGEGLGEQRLGWTTWALSRPRREDADETVLIL